MNNPSITYKNVRFPFIFFPKELTNIDKYNYYNMQLKKASHPNPIKLVYKGKLINFS